MQRGWLGGSDPIGICKSRHLNNRLEQDHRRIMRRVRSILGFKLMANARVIPDVIVMVHIVSKRQAGFDDKPRPSIAEQFEIL